MTAVGSTAAHTCHSSAEGADTRRVTGQVGGRVPEVVWVGHDTPSLARDAVCCTAVGLLAHDGSWIHYSIVLMTQRREFARTREASRVR
jgi:hypothetical protein